MKTLLQLLFMCITQSLSAQYFYQIHTSSSSFENKDYMKEMEKHLNHTFKRTISDSLISFHSIVEYSRINLDSMCGLAGIPVLSIEKSKGQVFSIEKGPENDCDNAIQICNDASFPGNSGGFGVQELPNNNTIDGCLTVEHESSWYYLNVSLGGTLHMRINPSCADDYDFAFWGPFTAGTAGANCPPITNPIRCSYAAGAGNTGLGNGAVDLSEGAFGNRWVAPLAVLPGEIYIVLIDNFSASSCGFDVDFSWNVANTSTATLGCTPVVLPVELVNFSVNKGNGINNLKWETISESNNDYFIIEKSNDPTNKGWEKIAKIDGAGNSNNKQYYSTSDHSMQNNSINYYKISQVDLNGKIREYSKIVSIDNRISSQNVVKILNLLGQEVESDEKGLLIYVFEDGTIEKRMN